MVSEGGREGGNCGELITENWAGFEEVNGGRGEGTDDWLREGEEEEEDRAP